jgi:hypothetical protein
MPGSRTNSIAADGAAGRTKPNRAEPPEPFGGGQEGHGSPRVTSTYHGREAETIGAGGRFAAQEPKLDWHDQPGPEWADQCVGVEPPIGGDSPVLGWAIDDA